VTFTWDGSDANCGTSAWVIVLIVVAVICAASTACGCYLHHKKKRAAFLDADLEPPLAPPRPEQRLFGAGPTAGAPPVAMAMAQPMMAEAAPLIQVWPRALGQCCCTVQTPLIILCIIICTSSYEESLMGHNEGRLNGGAARGYPGGRGP
jgi:hypothetical protein